MISNQVISSWEMARIRTLSDLHLTLLICLIHDNGWPNARWMLASEIEKMLDEELPKHGSRPQREIKPDHLVALRTLDDFDLTMIISDIHDHGWPMAAGTLDLAVEASWKAPDKKTVQ